MKDSGTETPLSRRELTTVETVSDNIALALEIDVFYGKKLRRCPKSQPKVLHQEYFALGFLDLFL